MNVAVVSRRWFRVAAAVAALSSFAPAAVANGVYQFITVGSPGNAADTSGYGDVAYEYQIGKYEVTIGQYAEFLNAVAQADPNGLFTANMGSTLESAGISQSGSSGSYVYSAIGPFGGVQVPQASASDRPITAVGWFNAARFANWMSNGKPTGPQSATTTENGAYDLSNWASGTAPARNSVNPNTSLAPSHYIPTENEWYKAAYYSPALNSGSGGYYAYATMSDTAPSNVVGAPNSANYMVSGTFSLTQSSAPDSSQNYLFNVGSFTASAYGTFDQSGNVREWNDLDGVASAVRGMRGGGWENNAPNEVSSSQRGTPLATNLISGFRLAGPVAVPEPSTWVMGLAGLTFGGFSMWRRKRG